MSEEAAAKLARMQAVIALMIGAFTFGTGASGVIVYIDGVFDAVESLQVRDRGFEKRIDRLEGVYFKKSPVDIFSGPNLSVANE